MNAQPAWLPKRSSPRQYVAETVTAAQRTRYWSEAVSSVCFPLDVQFADPTRFSGTLESWSLGKVALSRFRSDAVAYTRRHHHLKVGTGDDILVIFARRSETVFSQRGVTLTCGRNQFVIERSDSPYEFVQKGSNELWVLKMPLCLLKQRLRAFERCTSLVYDADAGVGGLLWDTVRLLPRRITNTDEAACEAIGTYLVELLALAVENDERVLRSRGRSMQAAHLARIERFIRQNLSSRALSPDMIASHNGISVRYLHELFATSGMSVSRWIRELRLSGSEQQLREGSRESIAEIAYRWGFGDHAQFSRHFRARFGCTPSEHRNRL